MDNAAERSAVITFRHLSIVTATISAALFLIMLLCPEIMFWLFQIPATESAAFMSRRAAILFLGVSLLSWLIRDTAHCITRQSINISFATMMFGLALLGALEYIRGYAGGGISLAVITELLLGGAYLKLWYANHEA